MEVEQVNEVEETTETTAETQETPQIQSKEDVEALRKEIDRLKAFESNFKSLQPKYQKLLNESKSSDVHQEMNDLKQLFKMSIAAQSQGMDLSPDELDDMPKKQQKNLLKDFEELEKRQQSQRQQEDYQKKAVATYSEAEEVFGDDVDTLHAIRNLIRSGDFDLAEKKIAKAKEKSVPKEDTKESEEQIKERIRKEIIAEEYKKRGWDISDTGSPTGGTSSDDQFLKEFSEGKRSAPEDFKRAQKLLK